MGFSFVSYQDGEKPSYFNKLTGWSHSREGSSWNSVEEAISFLARYFSGARASNSSKWTKKDLLEWMLERDVELEYF